jgi:hypothetical protein
MRYTNSSPYAETAMVNNQFLDVMTNRSITVDQSDVYWTITSNYNLRPDLLASDLYGDAALWWVFASRNPNTLKDPFFDFTTDTKIFIPKMDTLKTDLGI